MGVLRSLLITTVASPLLGCGPSDPNLDEVYPNNCGQEGPVTLLEVEPVTGAEIARAGEHYLVRLVLLTPDDIEIESWAVDRCGETPVLLRPATPETIESLPALGVAGEHLLSCDETTGFVSRVDPTGVESPRGLFPGGVEGCRAVPVGQGLAAQQRDGSTVWFHPDPTDPDASAVVVTESALVTDPDPFGCSGLRFDCKVFDDFGLDIRAASDELLVPLEDATLLAFSSTSLTSRIFDEGPVLALDVLPEGHRVVVDRDLGPTLIVDRRTGSSLELCCWDDDNPIRELGDWLVKGNDGPSYLPEPRQWANFRALHLPSGTYTELEGTETWDPFGRFTADTVLAAIAPYPELDQGMRYIVWPSTGERQPLPLPADGRVWTLPSRDGAYVLRGEQPPYELHYLAAPNETPELLIDDVGHVLSTFDGRLVFHPTPTPGEPTPLSAMRPDGSVVELEPSIVDVLDDPVRVTPLSPRPEELDEVVYVAEEDGRWLVKRTVLP